MESKKQYKKGYVPGVYDLFHMGHLNLIRRAKERSEYLMAGVLTDDLVKYFKGRKPVIPFEERLEIVSAIREVDEVVGVDFSNTYKMDAWKLYHYDAFFSGDDHEGEWDEEKRALQEVGSDIVFLPYTQSTSSTKIKQKIKEAAKPQRVYLFGAGKIGQAVCQEMLSESNRNKWKVEGFLDNSDEKHLTRIQGIPVYRPQDLKKLEIDSDFQIQITMKAQTEAIKQLESLQLGQLIVNA